MKKEEKSWIEEYWLLTTITIIIIAFVGAIFLTSWLFGGSSPENNVEEITATNVSYCGNNICENDENYSVCSQDCKIQSNDNFQNTGKLHWTNMPITYSYTSSCVGPFLKKMEWAFAIIENDTGGRVMFQKVESGANLSIICHKAQNKDALIYLDVTEYTFGMAKTLIANNTIESASITFWNIDNDTMPLDCYKYPRLSLHELLHTLGFAHDKQNRYSIMYPWSGAECMDSGDTVTIIATGETFVIQDKIDEKIVSCLDYIYSNGDIGNCSRVHFLQEENPCPEGQFQIDDTEYCCPYPDMTINADGLCDYI